MGNVLPISFYVLFVAVAMMQTSCDKLINAGAGLYLKANLLEICGKRDTACNNAVEAQFDSCHKKYEKQWDAYMDASPRNENKHLEAYSRGVYSCIVDKDGDPYFEFDPAALEE